MFSLLISFFLYICYSQPQTSGPTTGGGQQLLDFASLPNICAFCCADIIFVLERTVALDTPEWQFSFNTAQQMIIAPRSLNNEKFRAGVIQMGETAVESTRATVISGSPKTGIAFPLARDVLNEAEQDAYRANFDATGLTSTPDYNAAMKLAIAEFKRAGNPWDDAPQLETQCRADNFRRLIIWIVDTPLGSSPGSRTPCNPQGGASESAVDELIAMDGYNYVVGVTDTGSQNFASLQCFFPGVSDFSRAIREIDTYSVLGTNAASILDIDPCIGCENLDIVFLIDESSSQCNSDFVGSDQGIVCPAGRRDEWDQQIAFVKKVIGELAPTWSRHRVEVLTFGSKVRWTNIKLQCAGGAAADGENHLPGLTRPTSTCSSNNPVTPGEVQAELDKIRAEFHGGETATAFAVSAGMTSLEWVPNRKSGIQARKVLVLITDGGPNARYYDTTSQSNGKRYGGPCSCQGCPNRGTSNAPGNFCLGHYFDKFYVAERQTLNNFAVCTDDADPNPPAVRWHFGNAQSDKFQYIELTDGTRIQTSDKQGKPKSYPSQANSGNVVTYRTALDRLEIVPIVIEVGAAAENHKQDIDCILNKNRKGSGVLDADSFTTVAGNKPFIEATIGAICRAVRLRSSTERFMNSSNFNVFARWNQYIKFKQAYQVEKMQFKEWLAMKQQQQSFVKTSQISHVELMVGAVFGGGLMYFLGKKTKADYSQIPEFESV